MRYLVIFSVLVSSALLAAESSTVTYLTMPNGSSLLHNCKKAVLADDGSQLDEIDSEKAFICMTYLRGFVNGAEASMLASIAKDLTEQEKDNVDPDTISQKMQAASLYCLPDSMIPIQIAKAVVRYLEQHPAYLRKLPQDAVFNALMTSFPCGK